MVICCVIALRDCVWMFVVRCFCLRGVTVVLISVLLFLVVCVYRWLPVLVC